jgi:hypothetical protein
LLAVVLSLVVLLPQLERVVLLELILLLPRVTSRLACWSCCNWFSLCRRGALLELWDLASWDLGPGDLLGRSL